MGICIIEGNGKMSKLNYNELFSVLVANSSNGYRQLSARTNNSGMISGDALIAKKGDYLINISNHDYYSGAITSYISINGVRTKITNGSIVSLEENDSISFYAYSVFTDAARRAAFSSVSIEKIK